MADGRSGIDSGKDYRVFDGIDDGRGLPLSTYERDSYWREPLFVSEASMIGRELQGLYITNVGIALSAVAGMSGWGDD